MIKLFCDSCKLQTESFVEKLKFLGIPNILWNRMFNYPAHDNSLLDINSLYFHKVLPHDPFQSILTFQVKPRFNLSANCTPISTLFYARHVYLTATWSYHIPFVDKSSAFSRCSLILSIKYSLLLLSEHPQHMSFTWQNKCHTHTEQHLNARVCRF